MKNIFVAAWLLVLSTPAFSQEFYVSTEPANNLAKHALDIRFQDQGYFNSGYKSRNSLALAYGVSQLLLVQGAAYTSNLYRNEQHFEGGSLYAKYRFLSVDSVQTHFRGAVFARVSTISNPVINREISLDGDNSGLQGGIVFSQLLHKVAFSASGSYIRAFNINGGFNFPISYSKHEIAYSLSAGYLLLPRKVNSYDQLNLSLYAELLGKSIPGDKRSYLDAAPAVQFIFNSLFRLDLSYRVPLYNERLRSTPNLFLIGLEYKLYGL